MANAQLFQSSKGSFIPKANAVNHEGGAAYTLSAEQQLAQLAATGCMNDTFYADAQTQLNTLQKLASKVSPVMLAQTAIYARKTGYMKDMPALLLAMLAMRDITICQQAFARVIDNGKMLRNFVQIIRSGVTGRKSMGTRPKKLVQQWLTNATEQQLLNASVGTNPSLADVVKMVHPKPAEAWRAAWFAWLIGKPFVLEELPPITQAFERYKADRSQAVPDVPFQMLTSLELDTAAWVKIAQQGSWQMVRQNLNTFARHGVFKSKTTAKLIAEKLCNPQAIAKSRVLPYQLMTTFKSVNDDVPKVVSDALQDAMELALKNVPSIEGKIVICPDVSGSMGSPVTGYRRGATSTVRCIDVAALITAALLRKNTDACVLPFETKVVKIKLNCNDTVFTNAEKLASIGGGGTACSAPLAWLNAKKATADLVILVSDNESWADRHRLRGTGLMHEWEQFKQRNPQAKLVCLDIQPYTTSQAKERADILNIGGFSDEVFKLLATYAAGRLNPNHWVGVIQETIL